MTTTIAEQDIANLLGWNLAEINEMEQRCPHTSLFKYLSSDRAGFFTNPRIRFTQKSALNDPFELSQRWTEIATDSMRGALKGFLTKAVLQRANDRASLNAKLTDELKKRAGRPLTPEEDELVRQILASKTADQKIQEIVSQVPAQVEILVDLLLESGVAQQQLDKISEELGIFSLSATPDNEQLWGLYGSAGYGFAIEFDITHPFFLNGKNLPMFRRVKYTDERLSTFLSNPYYLFLVKNIKWGFEDEWRMLKKLSECDEIENHAGDIVHLCRVQERMIQAVRFGYRCSSDFIENGRKNMVGFDAAIRFFTSRPNPTTGKIEFAEI
jgi:hypothetical protein